MKGMHITIRSPHGSPSSLDSPAPHPWTHQLPGLPSSPISPARQLPGSMLPGSPAPRTRQLTGSPDSPSPAGQKGVKKGSKWSKIAQKSSRPSSNHINTLKIHAGCFQAHPLITHFHRLKCRFCPSFLSETSVL